MCIVGVSYHTKASPPAPNPQSALMNITRCEGKLRCARAYIAIHPSMLILAALTNPVESINAKWVSSSSGPVKAMCSLDVRKMQRLVVWCLSQCDADVFQINQARSAKANNEESNLCGCWCVTASHLPWSSRSTSRFVEIWCEGG